MDQLWYVLATHSYSAIKENELLINGITWVYLKGLMLSERSDALDGSMYVTFSKDKAVARENRAVLGSIGLRGDSDFKGTAQRNFLVMPLLRVLLWTHRSIHV